MKIYGKQQNNPNMNKKKGMAMDWPRIQKSEKSNSQQKEEMAIDCPYIKKSENFHQSVNTKFCGTPKCKRGGQRTARGV